MSEVVFSESRYAIAGAIRFADVRVPKENLRPTDIGGTFSEIEERVKEILKSKGAFISDSERGTILFQFNSVKAFGDEPTRTVDTIDEIRSAVKNYARTEEVQFIPFFCLDYGPVSITSPGKGPQKVEGKPLTLTREIVSSGGTFDSSASVVATEEFVRLIGHQYHFEALHLDGEPKLYAYRGKRVFWNEDSPFTGRAREIEVLHGILAQALAKDTPSTVLISGEAGIGKTRLLKEGLSRFTPAESASQKVLQNWVHLSDEDQPIIIPFQTLFDRLLRSEGIDSDKSAGFFNIMFKSADFWTQVDAAGLVRNACQLLGMASEKHPMILVMENLHFLKPSLTKIFGEIIASMKTRERKIIVLATSRSKAQPWNMDDALHLEPLSFDESVDLCRNLARKPEFDSALLKQCSGNPFFIQEYARCIRNGISPEGIEKGPLNFFLQSAFDSLSVTQQTIVKKASVFGERVPIPQLARLSYLSIAGLLKDLEPTPFFRFSEDGSQLYFLHDLFREAAYSRISQDQKKDWHLRLADLLVEQKSLPEQPAYHYSRTDFPPHAAATFLEAARRLLFVGQAETAGRYLDLCKDLILSGNDQGLICKWIELRMDLETKGTGLEARIPWIEDFPRRFNLTHRDEIRSFQTYLKAKSYYDFNSYDRAIETLELVEAALPDPFSHQVDLLRSRCYARKGRHRDAVRLSMKKLQDRALDQRARADFWHLLGFVAFVDRQHNEAKGHFIKAENLYSVSEEKYGELKSLLSSASISFTEGHLKESEERFHKLGQLAEGIGDAYNFVRSTFYLARIEFARIDFHNAVKLMEKARSLIPPEHDSALEAEADLVLAAFYRRLGKLGLARDCAENASREAKRIGNSFLAGQANRVLGLIELSSGNHSRAIQLLEAALNDLPGYTDQSIRAYLSMALCYSTHQEPEKAQKILNEVKDRFRKKTFSPEVRFQLLAIESKLEPNEKNANALRAKQLLKDLSESEDTLEKLRVLHLAQSIGGDLSREEQGFVHQAETKLKSGLERIQSLDINLQAAFASLMAP